MNFELCFIWGNWDWKLLDPLPKSKSRVRMWTQVCLIPWPVLSNTALPKNPSRPFGNVQVYGNRMYLSFSQLSIRDIPVPSRAFGETAWTIQHRVSDPLQKQCNKHYLPSSMKGDFHIHLRCHSLLILFLQTRYWCIRVLKVSSTWNYRM